MVNAAGRSRDDGFAVGQIAVDVFLQVDGAVFAESLDNLATLGVQTQDAVLHGREDSLTIPILSIRYATAGARTASQRTIVQRRMGPQKFTGGRIQSLDDQRAPTMYITPSTTSGVHSTAPRYRAASGGPLCTQAGRRRPTLSRLI